MQRPLDYAAGIRKGAGGEGQLTSNLQQVGTLESHLCFVKLQVQVHVLKRARRTSREGMGTAGAAESGVCWVLGSDDSSLAVVPPVTRNVVRPREVIVDRGWEPRACYCPTSSYCAC